MKVLNFVNLEIIIFACNAYLILKFCNYEVNPATGSCIEKISKAPVISWKDSYRLK